MMNRKQRVSGICFFSLMLVACSYDNQDLAQYISEVKQRKTRKIEPLPLFVPLSVFKFPDNNLRRDPFQPLVSPKEVDKDIPDDEDRSKPRFVTKRALLRSELIQINYAKATELALLIKEKQSSLLSAKGKVSVDTRTNMLWIKDSGAKVKEVRKLIKQLDVPVKQVLIEARIVEVTKDFAQDLGIRWGVSKSLHSSDSLMGANPVEPGAASPDGRAFVDRLNLDLMAAPLAGLAPASVGIALAQLGNHILLDLELSALESEGRAELISSPRLITTNQQPAVIDTGQEIPYQEATSSGATAVAFKKAVLSLKVIPQIIPDSKILMELKINQDTASLQLFNGIPAILTKEIHTNVLVGNGQTIVLGGIYQRDQSKMITRVPFWGQLPVVGHLFKNTQTVLKQDELLIFITPKIITTPLSAHDTFDEK